MEEDEESMRCSGEVTNIIQAKGLKTAQPENDFHFQFPS